MPETQTEQFEQEQRWFSPLLFWFCLLVSAFLFGAVLLTPRILTWTKLRYDYHQNQVELVSLENQVIYLHRVNDALENDPLFREELARSHFFAEEPDTESLPVQDSLNPVMKLSPPVSQPKMIQLPWYLPILESFQRHPYMKDLFLGVSALIAVIAFGLLPAPEEPVAISSQQETEEECKKTGWMKRRYGKK